LMGSAGMIPQRDDYLKFVRRVTAENDILFILDEIISFRLDYGGLQHLEGIKPDLTTVGKIMAGGTPGAAFGGRYEIMQQFLPAAPKVHHAGTLNANALTAAAGVAQLEQLTPELIGRINRLGESLAGGMRDVFKRHKIRGQVTGIGSLMNVHFSPVPIIDGKTSKEHNNKEALHLFHLSLTNKGILTPERGMFCISAPMSETEVGIAVDAVESTVTDLKPYIEKIWPELVS
jgi:glutamate-1-semialdehyde 2,1-aminomutase